jgi:hypothetical protein
MTIIHSLIAYTPVGLLHESEVIFWIHPPDCDISAVNHPIPLHFALSEFNEKAD